MNLTLNSGRVRFDVLQRIGYGRMTLGTVMLAFGFTLPEQRRQDDHFG